MKATDLFGRDGRSIMRTLENIKNPNNNDNDNDDTKSQKNPLSGYGQVEEKVEKIN